MKSIRFRLTAMVVVICILGMGLIAIIGSTGASKSLLEQSQSRIFEKTSKEGERINGWLEKQKSYLTAMAEDMATLANNSEESIVTTLAGHAKANDHYSEVYIGYPDGTGNFSSGWLPDYAGGWASYKRVWYSGAVENPTTAYLTNPYTDAISGNLCIAASHAVMKSDKVMGVVAADMYIDVLQNIVDATNVGEGSYAFLTDADGEILIHHNTSYGPDQEGNFKNLSEIAEGNFSTLLSLVPGEFATVQGEDGISRYYTNQTIAATGWQLYTAIPTKVVLAPIKQQIILTVTTLILVMITAGILIFVVSGRIVVKPINEVTQAAKLLAEGHTDISLNRNYVGEIGELINSFAEMMQIRQEQVIATELMAAGDLTTDISSRSDTDVMGHALCQLRNNLGSIIQQIYSTSHHVSQGAAQITDSSQSLAQSASAQATSMELLTASIQEISAQIQVSEMKTQEAKRVSQAVAQDADTGIKQMATMVQAVNEINQASDSISKVIKVIEDIAFQTNILSLNAAVEAAQAGQHGKGFAVVANEVGNLAAKSAAAAKETAVLIKDSIARAEEGTRIAQQTNVSLHTMLEDIKQSATLVDDVRKAVQLQSNLITQIDHGLGDINQVVIAGVANSKESAAAAAGLCSEASQMTKMVEKFKLAHQEE